MCIYKNCMCQGIKNSSSFTLFLLSPFDNNVLSIQSKKILKGDKFFQFYFKFQNYIFHIRET